jgi:hypothetical protein
MRQLEDLHNLCCKQLERWRGRQADWRHLRWVVADTTNEIARDGGVEWGAL